MRIVFVCFKIERIQLEELDNNNNEGGDSGVVLETGATVTFKQRVNKVGNGAREVSGLFLVCIVFIMKSEEVYCWW